MAAKTKVCGKCERRQPIANFYVHKSTRDRLQPNCKPCHCAQIAAGRERPAAYMKKCMRTIRSVEPRTNLDDAYLMKLWHKQEGLCALTGDPMTMFQGRGRVNTNCSIDRVNSKKGYARGNIQLVGDRANRVKQDFNTREFLDFCTRVLQNAKRRKKR